MNPIIYLFIFQSWTTIPSGNRSVIRIAHQTGSFHKSFYVYRKNVDIISSASSWKNPSNRKHFSVKCRKMFENFCRQNKRTSFFLLYKFIILGVKRKKWTIITKHHHHLFVSLCPSSIYIHSSIRSYSVYSQFFSFYSISIQFSQTLILGAIISKTFLPWFMYLPAAHNIY